MQDLKWLQHKQYQRTTPLNIAAFITLISQIDVATIQI